MANTATRAGKNDSRTITFKNREHEKFYKEYLPKCRHQDVYHMALIYCLGIDRDTRDHVRTLSRTAPSLHWFKPSCNSN